MSTATTPRPLVYAVDLRGRRLEYAARTTSLATTPDEAIKMIFGVCDVLLGRKGMENPTPIVLVIEQDDVEQLAAHSIRTVSNMEDLIRCGPERGVTVTGWEEWVRQLPALPTGEEALERGLVWLLNTEQPAAACVHRAGETITATGNRRVTFVPVGPDDRPVITAEVDRLEYGTGDGAGLMNRPTNPFTGGEARGWVAALENCVPVKSHTSLDDGEFSVSITLKQQAHRSLIAAVEHMDQMASNGLEESVEAGMRLANRA